MKDAIKDGRGLNAIYNLLETTMNASGLALNLTMQELDSDYRIGLKEKFVLS
jgi:hypothetical protein